MSIVTPDGNPVVRGLEIVLEHHELLVNGSLSDERHSELITELSQLECTEREAAILMKIKDKLCDLGELRVLLVERGDECDLC